MSKASGDAIEIDGAMGEGGGQVLRSSLALSIAASTPVVIERIRAGRKKPGLLRQHLTAVNAAACVSGGHVEGAELGASRIRFQPAGVFHGTYNFAVGSAGSATLVMQTVLPPLMMREGKSTITFSGGTHNPFAPPFDFIARVFAPRVCALGPKLSLHLARHGFFPAGGGSFVAELEGSALRPVEVVERGARTSLTARAIVSQLSKKIGNRELKVAKSRFDFGRDGLICEEVDSPGPGNAFFLEVIARFLDVNASADDGLVRITRRG